MIFILLEIEEIISYKSSAQRVNRYICIIEKLTAKFFSLCFNVLCGNNFDHHSEAQCIHIMENV